MQSRRPCDSTAGACCPHNDGTSKHTNANQQERIARSHLGSQTLFIGVDANGAAHYWNYYTETICVVEDGDATLYELAETPCTWLSDWCQHVRNKRGWDIGPHVGGSLVGDLEAALE